MDDLKVHSTPHVVGQHGRIERVGGSPPTGCFHIRFIPFHQKVPGKYQDLTKEPIDRPGENRLLIKRIHTSATDGV